jgi:hypothetical protein
MTVRCNSRSRRASDEGVESTAETTAGERPLHRAGLSRVPVLGGGAVPHGGATWVIVKGSGARSGRHDHDGGSGAVAPVQHAGVRAPAEPRRLRARPGEPLSVGFTVTGARPPEPQVLAYARTAGGIRQVHVPAGHVTGPNHEPALQLSAPGSDRLTLIAEQGLPATSQDLGALVTVHRPRRARCTSVS